MEIDRRAFFSSLGGAAAVSLMDSEAKADALEAYLSDQLDDSVAGTQPGAKNYPTVAELEAQIGTKNYRRGVGNLFAGGRNVRKLEPLPAHSGTAKFDLMLSLEENDGGLSGFIEYNTDLFKAETISRWMGNYRTLLGSAIADPSNVR